MAQVGRISGSLLQANLERNGIDLAFRNTTSDTQLLYFNVSSGKLGVNKGTTGYELDVAGTARSTNLLSNTNSVSNFTIENSTFSTLVGDINLNAGEAIVMAAMENGTIRIDDNIISTIETNANIDITPNGFGTTEIVNNLTTFGNIHSSGDINFDGTITLGNAAIDTVDFNADVNSDVIPDQRNTYNIGSSERKWDALYTNLLNGASVNVGALQVGNIQIDTRLGNTFYVAQNGNDSNGGDHIFAPFASISRALQAVDASIQGAVTIKVSPGEYQEELPLVVPNNVSIVGTDIRNCIIVPDTSSQSEDVFHLSDSSYISDLTIKNFYYNSVDNIGYAFRFAPNTVMSTRSPYIQNVTVITNESSNGAGDAGRGAWIDGNELNSASTLATMLFHSCTFISPGADVINMTNGVRVEWLNSFTYFANRGLHAFNGSEGRVSQDGSTVKYGAELRSIGSANVYGTYGAVANGADTLMYLIQHNFAYIGAGSKTDNNQADVIQANETVELNNGKVHYVSTDQLGNFRVGENFFINLEDGTTSINIDTLDVDALSGLAINSSSQTTIIKGDIVTTGNIDIQDNNIISLSGDLNIAGGTNIVNFSDNTLITNNLIIRDNFSFGGTLNVSGDQEADSLDFNVNFEQNFNPHQTLVHDLGTVTKKWSNVYLGKMQAGNITSNDNYITSDESNANLELRANGTGVLSVPSNNVRIDNNLTIVKETTLKDSIVTYEYGSNLIDNGSFPTDVSSWTPSGGGTISSAGGNLRIDAIGSAQNASQVVTAVESGKTYDFTTTFKSAVNSNAFYLRIFESGVGTLFEWNESSGLINDQVLTASITPNSTTISIIFRVVDNTVEWDDVTLIEDIGLVETITPVQVNVTGNTTQTSNTTQVGNITQTGNTVITGNLNISDEYTAASFKFNDNVLNVYREDLRLNPDDPYGALSLPQIVSAMQGAGATADDYAGQTEKNLINFLANGTSAPYANSYIDVNSSGTTTSSDSLAWLQYVANGTTSNTAINEFIAPIVEQLLEDEFANPGKYNSTIFLGDYFRANFLLKANGTGKVSFPANDVRITNNLFASSIIANDINVTQDLDINDIVITDSIIQIDDNFITTSISNADLELRATQDVSVPVNNVIVENILTVNRNTDINDLTVLGNITQTGNRNQTGNLNIIGNVTVTSTNIDSEIQFDDILFNDNTITSNDSNADLELRANGTGILSVPSNDVYVINNVLIGTINSNSINTTLAIAAEELELSSDIKLYDNVITTTASNSNLELRSFNADILLENLRFNNDTIQTTTLDINLIPAQNLIIAATGAIKIPVGTTAQRQIADNRIRFNNTNNVFEASSNSNTLSFGGVYSSDRRTSMLAHPANNTINFAVNQTGVGSVNAAGLNINGLTVDDISVQLNAITTTLSNSDLDLRANGTGKLNMYSTNFTGNIIQNTHAGTLDIVHTGYGKAKFSTAGAVALPSGTTAERIPSPELGTTRWNTENTILETWDGNTYISAAGNAATISTEEMEDLMLEYTLIFG